MATTQAKAAAPAAEAAVPSRNAGADQQVQAEQQADSSTAPGLIQRACACGASAPGGTCGSCDQDNKLGVQTKLTVGAAGDRWEREADRIADAVMSPTDGFVGVPPAITPVSELSAAQPSRAATDSQSSSFASTLRAERTSGTQLRSETREFLEPRFGRDLSAVRVHESTRSDQLNREIGARAFTHGSDIYFAGGQLNESSSEGLRLLAHEVAHTLQQDAHAGASHAAEPSGHGQLQRSVGGFFRNIGRLFTNSPYSDDDLLEYLDAVAAAGGIIDDWDSDNLALGVVDRMRDGGDLLGHDDTPELRKILIREMQKGATLADEESAILYLLSSVDVLDFERMFTGDNALDGDELRGDIDNENTQELDEILGTYGIEAEGLTRQSNYVGCDDDQRAAIEASIRLSEADLDGAIAQLGEPDSAAVRSAFWLGFRVESTEAKITAMTARLRAIRNGLRRIHYSCDWGENAGICQRGGAAYAHSSGYTPAIGICFVPDPTEDESNFAQIEDDATRSRVITHEAAHTFLRVTDLGYYAEGCVETEFRACINAERVGEDCGTEGLTPDERFDNADSYACFVYFLARLAPSISTSDEDEADEDDERLAESEASFRGQRLRITFGRRSSGRFDLGLSGLAGDDSFRLDGVPDASGFTSTWTLQMGDESVELSPNHNKRVTLPGDVLSRLRVLHDAGVESVKLTVETQVPPSDTIVLEADVYLFDDGL